MKLFLRAIAVDEFSLLWCCLALHDFKVVKIFAVQKWFVFVFGNKSFDCENDNEEKRKAHECGVLDLNGGFKRWFLRPFFAGFFHEAFETGVIKEAVC